MSSSKIESDDDNEGEDDDDKLSGTSETVSPSFIVGSPGQVRCYLVLK